METYTSGTRLSNTVDNLAGTTRDAANRVGTAAQDAAAEGKNFAAGIAEDAFARGKEIATKASDKAKQLQAQAAEKAKEVQSYARENVTIVALASLTLGIIVGRFLIPRRD
ncbi:MAG: hypothetical protein ABIT01_01945 [Thermoanaerobaculia bacterium]